MRAMLSGDGGGTARQRASAESLTERHEVVGHGGRGGRQRRGASEPAPGREGRPVTCIEPQCFGSRRTSERRYSGVDITGQCPAGFSRLMYLGVQSPSLPIAFVCTVAAGPGRSNP
jgi:hypothetical protein